MNKRGSQLEALIMIGTMIYSNIDKTAAPMIN